MQLNSDGTRATIDLRGELTASELEDAITRLAVLRSNMTPPVTEKSPNPFTDPDKPILMESDCALTAALRRNGGIRLWLRNRGFGWVGYEVEPGRARAIANYILSRTPNEGINLFGEGDGTRH
jgi:hypothetical protein